MKVNIYYVVSTATAFVAGLAGANGDVHICAALVVATVIALAVGYAVETKPQEKTK